MARKGSEVSQGRALYELAMTKITYERGYCHKSILQFSYACYLCYAFSEY